MAVTSKDAKIAAATGIVAFVSTLILRQVVKPKPEEIPYTSPYLGQTQNWKRG